MNYFVVMGIKGRRVHMIEELSETIISFQRGNFDVVLTQGIQHLLIACLLINYISINIYLHLYIFIYLLHF